MSTTLVKRVIGAALGVLAAVLVLLIGFWKTLLIGILAFAGWWLAGSRRIPQSIIDFAVRVFHLR